MNFCLWKPPGSLRLNFRAPLLNMRTEDLFFSRYREYKLLDTSVLVFYFYSNLSFPCFAFPFIPVLPRGLVMV